MDLPRVRGTLLITRTQRAVVTVHCPECGAVHRYDEGPLADPAVQAKLGQGFVDEWIPCRADLPGNFYRVLLSPPKAPAAAARVGGSPPPPSPKDGRRRRRRRQKAPRANAQRAQPEA